MEQVVFTICYVLAFTSVAGICLTFLLIVLGKIDA